MKDGSVIEMWQKSVACSKSPVLFPDSLHRGMCRKPFLSRCGSITAELYGQRKREEEEEEEEEEEGWEERRGEERGGG